KLPAWPWPPGLPGRDFAGLFVCQSWRREAFRKSEQREREQPRAKRHLWGPRDAVTGVGPTGSLLYVRVAVDDDDAAAGEQPVDDETNADVRRVLADRRTDLRPDLP